MIQQQKNLFRRLGVSVLLLWFFVPRPGVAEPKEVDLMLVLDLSGSMSDVYKSEHYRNVLDWIVDFGMPDDRVGVITFGSREQVEHEIKKFCDFDPQIVGKRIARLAKYTNVASGLERAYYQLQKKGRTNAQHVILLFSDGRIDLPGGKSAEKKSEEYLRSVLVPAIAREKVRIFAFVPEQLQADYPLLQEWVELTKGKYYRGLPDDKTAFREALLYVEPEEKKVEPPPVSVVTVEKIVTQPAPPVPVKPDTLTRTVVLTILGIVLGGAVFVLVIAFLVVRPILRNRQKARELANILDEIRVLRREITQNRRTGTQPQS